MDAKDIAEADELRALRRFRLFDQLCHDILAAQREAQAAARLDVALQRCCPELNAPAHRERPLTTAAAGRNAAHK